MPVGHDLERTAVDNADWPLKAQPVNRQLPRKRLVTTNDHFPCLVHKGCKAESLNDCSSEYERNHRIARNALRYLTYGVSFEESQLLTVKLLKFVFWRSDPSLLKAMREELQTIFNNAYIYLSEAKLDQTAEDRMQMLLSHLLCMLPYLEPPEDSHFYIPQKINGEWTIESFRFKKIDISPQRKKSSNKDSFFSYLINVKQILADLLAKIIDDRDRIYAYSLVCEKHTTDKQEIPPILLFKGSDIPSGQGAFLNWINNFVPRTSVGEGHDLTKVEEWLKNQSNVRVAGHSKGGTLAMILTVKFPEHISEAHCLNPALLNIHTIDRLKESLDHYKKYQQKNNDKLSVNIYVQYNDPIFWLGHLILPGANVYSIGDKGLNCAKLESHGLYICGRESVTVNLRGIEVLDNSPNKRSFYTDIKEMLDWFVFPLLYLGFVGKTALRKLTDVLPQKVKENTVVSGIKTGSKIVLTGVYVGVFAAVTTPVLLLSLTFTVGKLIASNTYKRFFRGDQKQAQTQTVDQRSNAKRGRNTADITVCLPTTKKQQTTADKQTKAGTDSSLLSSSDTTASEGISKPQMTSKDETDNLPIEEIIDVTPRRWF